MFNFHKTYRQELSKALMPLMEGLSPYVTARLEKALDELTVFFGRSSRFPADSKTLLLEAIGEEEIRRLEKRFCAGWHPYAGDQKSPFHMMVFSVRFDFKMSNLFDLTEVFVEDVCFPATDLQVFAWQMLLKTHEGLLSPYAGGLTTSLESAMMAVALSADLHWWGESEMRVLEEISRDIDRLLKRKIIVTDCDVYNSWGKFQD